MDKNMIKIIGGNLIHDGNTSRTYAVGDYLKEALCQILSLSHQPIQIENAKKMEDAKDIIRKFQSEGLFINEPLYSYHIPSFEQLKNPPLYEMTFAVTERCNLRCDYCPYSSTSASSKFRTHRKYDMSIEIADQALELFYKYASPETCIGFYGGEPFLNLEIIKYVINNIKENMQDWRGIATITTNFTIYNPEIGDFLAENNILLLVSLDGPEKIHDRHRKTANGKNTFKTIITNLADLKERHPKYFSNFVANNTTLAPPLDLESISDFFSGQTSLNFSRSRFSPANATNPEFYPSMGYNDPSKVTREIEDYLLNKLKHCNGPENIRRSPILHDICQQWFKTIASPNVLDKENMRPFKSCIPGHKIMVNPDGRLSICEKCETLNIGHIQTGVDMEKASKIISQWQEILEENCLNCWASGFCNACYLVAWDGEKFNREKLTRFCDFFKRRTEKLLEIYLTIKSHDPHYFDFLKEEDGVNPPEWTMS